MSSQTTGLPANSAVSHSLARQLNNGNKNQQFILQLDDSGELEILNSVPSFPRNEVNLQLQAQNLNNHQATNQFTVRLDDSEERTDLNLKNLLTLQVPNDASSLLQAALFDDNLGPDRLIVRLDDSNEQKEFNIQSSNHQANFQPDNRHTNIVKTSNIEDRTQFSVKLDDDSLESEEEILCLAGQLIRGNRCVSPTVNRNIFIFGRDTASESKSILQTELPLPRIDYNIIFVRSSPTKTNRQVAPSHVQKKTVVYVLEEEEEYAEDIFEVQSYPDADPEVYYVKVRPGENPQLPGGIDLDLQSAFSHSAPSLIGINKDLESSIELTIGSVESESAESDLIGLPLFAETSSNVHGIPNIKETTSINSNFKNMVAINDFSTQNIGIPLTTIVGDSAKIVEFDSQIPSGIAKTLETSPISKVQGSINSEPLTDEQMIVTQNIPVNENSIINRELVSNAELRKNMRVSDDVVVPETLQTETIDSLAPSSGHNAVAGPVESSKDLGVDEETVLDVDVPLSDAVQKAIRYYLP